MYRSGNDIRGNAEVGIRSLPEMNRLSAKASPAEEDFQVWFL